VRRTTEIERIFSCDWTERTCSKCGRKFVAGVPTVYCTRCKQRRDAPIVTDVEENVKELSRSEWRFLRLIAKAKENKEIAYDLHLSYGTARMYASQIFLKIGVHNRTAAALWYLAQEMRTA